MSESLMMVDSLGPYAAVLNQIVIGRETQDSSMLMESSFIKTSDLTTVYRAAILTEE